MSKITNPDYPRPTLFAEVIHYPETGRARLLFSHNPGDRPHLLIDLQPRMTSGGDKYMNLVWVELFPVDPLEKDRDGVSVYTDHYTRLLHSLVSAWIGNVDDEEWLHDGPWVICEEHGIYIPD